MERYGINATLTLMCILYLKFHHSNNNNNKQGHVKLVDFGLAKEGVQDAAMGASSLCGTPEYLSPEVLDRQGHGTAVDWWNLGMVAYEMLTGLPPWYTTNREKLFQAIRGAPLKFPMSVNRTAALFIQVESRYCGCDLFLSINGAAECNSHESTAILFIT